MRTDSVLGPDGPRLCAEKCSTCIFRPGNLMHLQPGRVRQMVRDTLAAGSYITCHATLPYADTGSEPAICRGFYDAHGPRSNLIRIWGRLGGFDEIEPPCLLPGREGTDDERS
jgi:hypothetical protein